MQGDLVDAQDIIRAALDTVKELRDVGHVAAYSVSAGVKPGIRARVFVETEKPLTISQQQKMFVLEVQTSDAGAHSV